MKVFITVQFSVHEIEQIMEEISELYGVAYPKIKDWVDSQEAKHIKSKYSAITNLITELSLLRRRLLPVGE